MIENWQPLLSIIVFGIASWFAVYMVKRAERVSVEAIEETDDVSMSIYDKEIAPEAERQHPELVKRIRAKARELAANGKEITTDDIHEAMPLPPGIDGRVLGSAFYPRGHWRKTGYTPSRRRENHSRPIARWVLKSEHVA